MKNKYTNIIKPTAKLLGLTASLVLSISVISLADSVALPALQDDFENAERSSNGQTWIVVDDSSVGGKSTHETKVDGGKLNSKGRIDPARGMPGWISRVLVLAPDGSPKSASAYDGIRIKIKVTEGIVSLQVQSSDVVNFDFHAFTIMGGSGKFEEVEIPFADFTRGWSEQTELNLENITAIAVLAVGMQSGDFDFEVEEISFYTSD